MKYTDIGTYELDGQPVWLWFDDDTIGIDGYCTLHALEEIAEEYRKWRDCK